MIKKPKIKAIIFDLGGVVMHGGFRPFINRYCAECLTKEGKKKIVELERELNMGNISADQFYDDLQELFDVHLTDKEIHDFIVDSMTKDEQLIEMIPKLKSKKVALFSNTLGKITADVLSRQKLNVDQMFDEVFMSGDIHLVKPDENAYHYVLDTLKVEPHETLMVDDRANNIQGAKKIGMQGIVYKNANQFKRALSRYELVHKEDESED